MKRLEIKNFTKSVMDITSDYITIRYSTDQPDKYVIGIDGKFHYKLAIHKDSGDEFGYTVWLWSMDKNMSYPMSIDTTDLTNTSAFVRYLDNVIKVADRGEFAGEEGNRITFN